MAIDPSRRRSVYGIVFLTLFLDLVGFSIIFPIFAHLVEYYSQHDYGVLHWSIAVLRSTFPEASDGQVTALFGGVVFAVYALLQFIMAPVWGTLSDRIGRRPILLLSVCGNCLAYILWIFAGNFVVLLLSRLMAGAMSGNISTASAAMADISDEKSRAKAMGLVGAAIGLGFIIGPAIGGLLYSYGPTFESAQSTPSSQWFAPNPFSLIAACAALLSLVNALFLWRKFPETLHADIRAKAAARSQRSIHIFSFFTDRLGHGVARCNVVYLVYMILFAGMESTLVFLAKDFVDFSPGNIAALFVMIGMIGVCIQGGLIRRLVPRYGERKLLIFGIIVQIPGYLSLAMVESTQSSLYLIIGAGCLAVGSASLMPSLSSLLSRAAAVESQGQAMGVFRSVGSLGRALGPFLGAVCYFLLSPSTSYVIAAVLVLVPLVLVLSADIGQDVKNSTSYDGAEQKNGG